MSFRTMAEPQKETFTRKIKVSRKTETKTTIYAFALMGIIALIAAIL